MLFEYRKCNTLKDIKLLLLPGTACMKEVMFGLAEGFKNSLPDNIGIYISELPYHSIMDSVVEEDICLDLYMRKIYEDICIIGDNVIIVGHSMGGTLALQSACLFDEVKSVISIAGAGKYVNIYSDETIADKALTESQSSCWHEVELFLESANLKHHTSIAWADFILDCSFDLLPELSILNKPVKLIGGDLDIVCIPEALELTCGTIKNSSYTSIKNARHGDLITSLTEKVVEESNNWLKNQHLI